MNYCKQCGQKHESSVCPLAPSNWPGNVSMTPESFDAAIQAAKAQGRAEGIKEAATVCDAHVLRTSDKWEARSQAQGNAVAHDCAAAIRALSSPPPDTETTGVCEWKMSAPITHGAVPCYKVHGTWFSGFSATAIDTCPYCGKPISVKQ